MQEQKTAEIKIRVTPRVKARLTHIANDYAEGNLSAWMEYAGLNARRKQVKTGTNPATKAVPAKNPDEVTGISSRRRSR